MAAPVLTPSQQKSSLTGKNKKKKVIKNVLGLPSSLKVECHVVEGEEEERLNKILERLLPPVRLPVQANPRFRKDQNISDTGEQERRQIAKSKRNQLSLGVNALNKSIKKDLISAALLANDIQPKFLVQHLNLLCTHNKVPFLLVPGLRDVTKNCLGFPCIAMGFKKDFNDFTEVVKEIKTIFEVRKVVLVDNSQEREAESSESDYELEETCLSENTTKSNEVSFTYLYRSSKKERVFIPEEYNGGIGTKKSESDFIMIQNDIKEMDSELKESGISSHLLKKRKKKKLLDLKGFNEDNDDDDDEEEDLKVPKKKKKPDWFIDNVGSKPKFKYSPANITKAHSNPNRIGKKQK